MQPSTEKLIRELAEKLGTTAEHLWGVLIKQAPISGTCNAIFFGLCIFFIIWIGRFLVRKTTGERPAWDDECAAVAWFCWGLLTAMIVCVFWIELPRILSAFFNPEYWALKQILK